jgi:hypothetical protein
MLAAMWLTAIGTILVAIVAVGVALWSERRTDKRVAAEREESARQLAAERAHSAEQLAAEQAHAVAMLAQEQAFSREQVAEERSIALDREQLTEAAAIQVLDGVEHVPLQGDPGGAIDPDRNKLAAIIVNHGRFAISSVDMRFYYEAAYGTAYLPAEQAQSTAGGWDFGTGMAGTTAGPPGSLLRLTRLTPWDRALRFDSAVVDASLSFTAYAAVRWTDRWGNRWEHRQGDVRKIDEDAPWQ